jgi:TPR repeat protein
MHFYGVGGGPVDYAAAATWWKRAADQGDADAITNLPLALALLFPPGTRIELVNMSTPRLNGLRGVVDATPDGKIVCSGVGKIAVVLEGGRGTKAVLFENLVVVPPTEAEEKRRKKKAKAKRQKAKKQAGGGGAAGKEGGGEGGGGAGD